MDNNCQQYFNELKNKIGETFKVQSLYHDIIDTGILDYVNMTKHGDFDFHFKGINGLHGLFCYRYNFNKIMNILIKDNYLSSRLIDNDTYLI